MEKYDEITSRIKELAGNPDALSSHIQNNVTGINEVMPDISQAVGNHMARSVSYLNSKIPKSFGDLPLAPKWEPSEAQKQQFERHYNAVNNPTDVLHQIASGEISSESMEALRSVHPDLLANMQSKLRQQIKPDIAEKLPHHVKRGLSMFMGSPLENSDIPGVKLSNQIVFQAQQQVKQAQNQQLVGKTTQKGLDKLQVSSREATRTQKEEDSKA